MTNPLVVEEEHANDMHDLLVAYPGNPMLEKGTNGYRLLSLQGTYG